MVRKLLKRKLKIVSLKKLKTIKRTKTSLSLWALKRLCKKNEKTTFMRYPRKLPCFASQLKQKGQAKTIRKTKGCFLHRKELLNQLMGNFPFLVAKNRLTYPVQRVTYSGKRFATQNRKQLIRTPSLLKFMETKTKLKKGVGGAIATSASSVWPLYGLSFVTKKQNTMISPTNWKNIYSLDQLMCHQHDAQFRKRQSNFKSSLIESQKLTALYGKLSKKQKLKLRQSGINHKRSQNHITLLLESRLDVALKRCFVFETLRNAQHWISQGRVFVNHNKVTSPSYTLQVGDLLAIGKESKIKYKNLFLNQFYKYPKESKYMQSGKLLSRWKEWATLYNYLSSHHRWLLNTLNNKMQPSEQRKKDLLSKAFKGSAFSQEKHKVKFNLSKTLPWPDKGIQTFWYLNGRYALSCLDKEPRFCYGKSLGANNLLRWFGGQRWPRMSLRYRHWKLVYRRRILVFGRWLLSAQTLSRDGLYLLRWHRGFIRKKSTWIRASHRKLSLQKPLHFEVSYKKLCALYLYPPQRVVWPCMIDFKKI